MANEKVPDWVYENEATERMQHFRDIAPTRKPNQTEYLSYLNRIESRLGIARLHDKGQGGFSFRISGAHLNDVIFEDESITWSWEVGGGGKRNHMKRSVKFFTIRGNAFLELDILEFGNKHDEHPVKSLTILIGNEPTATLIEDGATRTVSLEEAIPLFSKPK